MTKYHDEERGVPLHDGRGQFEFLMMEVMQCGLNWNMMMQKREIFRACIDGFDYDKIAAYGEADVERILSYEGMIRSRRKIEAVIHNARCFQKVRKEFGSFSEYPWGFSGGKTILYACHQKGRQPAKNALSEQISRETMRKPAFATARSWSSTRPSANGSDRRPALGRGGPRLFPFLLPQLKQQGKGSFFSEPF